MRKISRFAAVALFSLTSGLAFAAQGPIYKCVQADGTLLYSDYPCGGTVLDIHPESADPNAKERLARAQSELDRAAAARSANEQEVAARREELRQLQRQSEAAQAEPASNASDIYYGTGYDAYGPYAQGRVQGPNFHGSSRGHRASLKSRFHHGDGRVPAVIRRPQPPR
jgi:hypothetical protein